MLMLLTAAASTRAAEPSLVVADRWAAAKDAVATLDWPAAESRYAALAKQNVRGSSAWTIATLGQAVATQHAQPASASTIAEAAGLYRDVINASSDERYVARAMMNLGRIAELPDYADDSIDLSGARTQYEQVMRRWPDEPIGSEAALRTAATLVMAFDAPDFASVRSGITLLRQWARDHPANPYAAMMWQYAGDACFRPLADYRGALDCYDQADRLGWADAGNQGSWYWRCARLADVYLHDHATAVRYYTKLVKHTPTHAKAYAAAQRLIELGAPVPTRQTPTTNPAGEGTR